jgi:hypothetical protein
MKIKSAARGAIVLLVFIACEVKERTVEGSVEPFFSATQGIEWVIEREVDHAGKRIDVAVYTFTSRPLAQALLDAHNRGVRVRLILDPAQAAGKYSKATYLFENGMDVRTERGAGLMHHKFALIDDSILIIGSFNWTAAAEEVNDENILLLKGFSATYKSYSREFERIWRDARAYTGKLPETCDLSATDTRALRKNVGEKAKVCGKVVRVGYSERSNTYFLDFSDNEGGFTAVIFSSAVEKFDILNISILEYEGANVGITGELIDHPEYGLEIIVEEPSQIQVFK